MPRFRVPLVALALLVVMVAATPTTGGAQEATPAVDADLQTAAAAATDHWPRQ